MAGQRVDGSLARLQQAFDFAAQRVGYLILRVVLLTLRRGPIGDFAKEGEGVRVHAVAGPFRVTAL